MNIYVCLNINYATHTDGSDCSRSSKLDNNKKYTIRIFYNNNGMDYYLAKEWRPYKYIGGLKQEEAKKYLNEEHYLEYEKTDKIEINKIKIENNKCKNLPNIINKK